MFKSESDEEIAEEHKKEQDRQAMQRAGFFKTEDSESKTGSIPMEGEESSSEPMETEEVKGDLLDHKHSRLEPTGKLWLYGQDTGGIKWRQGSFYFMKPNQKSVGNDTWDDLYLLQIPERIWDILLESDFSFEYVGAPPYDKVTRGKKCRKLKPDKEAGIGMKPGRPRKDKVGKHPRDELGESSSVSIVHHESKIRVHLELVSELAGNLCLHSPFPIERKVLAMIWLCMIGPDRAKRIFLQ
eukprot:g34045.t1